MFAEDVRGAGPKFLTAAVHGSDAPRASRRERKRGEPGTGHGVPHTYDADPSKPTQARKLNFLKRQLLQTEKLMSGN